MLDSTKPVFGIVGRIRLWHYFVILTVVIFGIRAFYLQVIKHDYYKSQALVSQLKEYEIPPSRGVIMAHNGSGVVPIVLNEIKYTLFADPQHVVDTSEAAGALQPIIGGNTDEIREKLSYDTRYSVLAKKLGEEQKQRIEGLSLKGIGLRETPFRTYPQGTLASQLLGFVNDDGEGKYGIEQALDESLRGKPGQLKAITDADGVPLVTNPDNVITEAIAGKDIVLTIDLAMQKQTEDLLKKGLDRARSKSGSALVMDPNTGDIKAMANYPTYNPSEFYNVKDAALFANATVSEPLEIGSTMKSLTAAAVLNEGKVSPNTSYYDPAQYRVDGYLITNIEEDGGAANRTVSDILQYSLNTGATWLLMQLGGGEINEKARTTWHNYMVNHYYFGKLTGVEQGYEAPGVIPDPNEGFGLNLTYANTAFGQGMTATPLQLGAALSSVLNGGIYYKPTLVDQLTDDDGRLVDNQPVVINDKVVNNKTSSQIVRLMENVVEKNYLSYGMRTLRNEYSIGGKTGTAEIANPEGGYYDDRFNGTFTGFVGGDKVQYVIVVKVNEPKIPGYAGSQAAAPIFSDIADMLIDNFAVSPKGR